MRRFSGRSVAVLLLALCLSMVPVEVASASPWAGLGAGGGVWAKVELVLARAWSRWSPQAEAVVTPRGEARLKEGTVAEPIG